MLARSPLSIVREGDLLHVSGKVKKNTKGDFEPGSYKPLNPKTKSLNP